MDLLLYILSGAIVGFVIGLTGVGGGSFMTPLLLAFGYSPSTAVGTDLLYAAITKFSGTLVHKKQNTVNWRIVVLLGSGSVPASILTILLLQQLKTKGIEYEHILTGSLGVMLILTSCVLLFHKKIAPQNILKHASFVRFVIQYRDWLTVVIGVALGFLVTLSSVGAGAFGAAVLMILYPKLPAAKVVGTDLAHAVPLTAIAGLGHMHLGHVDYSLLLCLLVGSIPAINLGARLATMLPNRVLQPIMASLLLLLGIKYALV